MATTEFINFPTGSMGNLSVYKMRGLNRLVVRKKSGPTRKQLQNEDRYAITRCNMQEWKASTLASKQIIRSFLAVRHLCDGGYIGKLNSITKNLQKLDTTHPMGRRSVPISAATYKLEGFNINRKMAFDDVLLYPLKFQVDRIAGTASIELPPLHPNINLINSRQLPCYRFIFMLGMVSDVVYNENENRYRPVIDSNNNSAIIYTPWYNAHIDHAGNSYDFALDDWSNNPSVSLVLSVGIEFGLPVTDQLIKYVKFSGAAKILRVE